MLEGRIHEGRGLAKAVRQLLRQAQPLLQALAGLLWIPQRPQDEGRIAAADYPGVQPVEDRMGAVLLRVVEGAGLLQMRVGSRERSLQERGEPQGRVGLEEEGGGLVPLRQRQEVLRQFLRRLVLRPDQVIIPQAPQHREHQRGVFHLLAEYARPRIGASDLWGGNALARHQRWAEDGLYD